MTRTSALTESELLSVGCLQRCVLGALRTCTRSLWLAQQPTGIAFVLFLLRGKLRLTGKVNAWPKAWARAGHPGRVCVEGWLRVAEQEAGVPCVHCGRACAFFHHHRADTGANRYVRMCVSCGCCNKLCCMRGGKPPTGLLRVLGVGSAYVCPRGCIPSRSSGGGPISMPFPVARGCPRSSAPGPSSSFSVSLSLGSIITLPSIRLSLCRSPRIRTLCFTGSTWVIQANYAQLLAHTCKAPLAIYVR